MGKVAAGVLLIGFGLLSGCGDADVDAAAQLVGEAQALYDGRVRGSPGKLPGTFILSKEDIRLCVNQMEQARAKLQQLHSEYSGEKATLAIETKILEGAIISRLGSCNEMQHRFGNG